MRQLVRGHLRTGFFDRALQAEQRVAQTGHQIDIGPRGTQSADPGELQQVVDQLLHPLGTVDREVDVLVRPIVQLPGVTPLQHLAEARHLSQRFLQVV
jgi:hypothetical protein